MSLDDAPPTLDDDMDPEQLEEQLNAFYEESTEGFSPLSFTELLLGNWDGFDMASALFNVDPTVDVVVAAQPLHSTTETVRPPTAVCVGDIVAQMRQAHTSEMHGISDVESAWPSVAVKTERKLSCAKQYRM